MAQLFYHPAGMAKTAGVILWFRGPFAFGGSQNTVHQASEMGLVEGAAGFHRFVQNRVGSLLAEAELEKSDQHQVVNNTVLAFNGLFKPAIQLTVEAVKPAAGAVAQGLKRWAFVESNPLQCRWQALGQRFTAFHRQKNIRRNGAQGLVVVAHVSAAPVRVKAVVCPRLSGHSRSGRETLAAVGG